MDAEKYIVWFNGEQQPVIPFEHVNLKPILKMMDALNAEHVARYFGEWYPDIDDLY